MGSHKDEKTQFQGRHGYATRDARHEYLVQQGLDDDDAKRISESLEADRDISKPLYFWQLYSLIGPQPIFDIVRNFYKRVYEDDEDEEFRLAFTRLASMEHHIGTQAYYWIDAMGGGRAYHGGHYRLEFHHRCNASEVMNAHGAKRWMYHMRATLDDYDFAKLEDPRIKPCILEFLKSKMKSYAHDFRWKFDDSDFQEPEDEPETLSADNSEGSVEDQLANGTSFDNAE